MGSVTATPATRLPPSEPSHEDTHRHGADDELATARLREDRRPSPRPRTRSKTINRTTLLPCSVRPRRHPGRPLRGRARPRTSRETAAGRR